MRDWVDCDELLEPAWQRIDGDERIGQERQREQDEHRDALDPLGAARDRPEPGEDPRQRPPGEDRQQDRAGDAEYPASRAVAERDPGRECQGRGDQVAHQVGEHRSGERRDPRDRQRLEAIEHALVEVLAQLHASGHARGQHRLRDDPRNEQRQVLRDAAGDRAAEDVGEHRREQQRLDRDVEELLGVTAHLLERPPRHR